MKVAALLATLCALPQAALAQEQACKSISSESERLACYDRAAAKPVRTSAGKNKSHHPPPPELDVLLNDVNQKLGERTKTICRGC